MAITNIVAQRLALMLAYMKDEGCTRSTLVEVFGNADSTLQTGLRNKFLCKGELIQAHKRSGTCAKRMYVVTEDGRVWLDDMLKNDTIKKMVDALQSSIYSRKPVTVFGQEFCDARTAIGVSCVLIYSRTLKVHESINPTSYYNGNTFAEVLFTFDEFKEYFSTVKDVKNFLVDGINIRGITFFRASLGARDDIKVSVGCWFDSTVTGLMKEYPNLDIDRVVQQMVEANPSNVDNLKRMEYRLKALQANHQALIEKQKKLNDLVVNIGGLVSTVSQGKSTIEDLQNLEAAFKEANKLLADM